MLRHPKRAAEKDRSLKVGIIGLGVGTLSTYGKPGDHLTFYELDPDIPQIATEHFSFLSGAECEVKITIGDARVSLEREWVTEGSQQYDVLIIDAFSGDAIPIHLLTHEAFKLYVDHLHPQGILAVHISNRYVDLLPVVLSQAKFFGKEILYNQSDGDSEQLIKSSSWVLLTDNTHFANDPQVVETIEEINTETLPSVFWTDDFYSLTDVLMD